MSRISTRGWAAVLTAVAVLGAAAVAARKRSDPAIAWLAGARPATWIVYPHAVDTSARDIVELDTSFATSFHLDAVPASAVLRFRAFRSGGVRINGREAPAPGGPDWKAERSADVAGLLRVGENVIEARVSNAMGPPALWLALELPGATLVSDGRWTSSWAGATARPASPATDPRSGRMHDPEGRVMGSMAALALEWRRLLLLSALALLAVGGAALLRRQRPGWPLWSPASPWPLRLALGAVALLWAALFVNNTPWLPVGIGFDAPAHLEYARFIQEEKALPFADDGWQMFQPPLYYLLLAGACSAAGVSAASMDAAAVVRGLGLVVGLAHLAVVAAALRLLFPERPGRQAVGLLVGGFLPCMLYLHQYPANEPLVAMLSSAAVLASLHLLRQDEPGWPGHAVLGLLLGLALLAKVSALLLLPPVFGALAARALLGDRRWLGRRVAAIALSTATLLASCGWYYGMVWQRFGTPFVGGWDPRRGMGWWQDPGYRTLDDFLRFGRTFTSPLLSGFNGFWDGLYATLWGDGLISGVGDVTLVPPWWSPSLMSAALLLALAPTLAILAGAVRAFTRWLRRPDAVTGMLVGLALVAFLSIVSMAVAVPAVGADKASYGLLALVPLCAFAGLAIGERPRWGAAALAPLLLVWGLTSFATYWIDASSAKARLLKGVGKMHRDQVAALPVLREAHALAPRDWSVRLVLAQFLLETAGPRAEVERLLEPHEQLPDLLERHVALAFLANQDGDPRRAERALRRAVDLNPDDLDARMRLAALVAGAGDFGGAIRELREALRINPQHQAAHLALASVYERVGDARAASMHQAYAARLKPPDDE